jgi:hypothetical protein
VGNAGLGAAINNAVSRVGQPLLLALIYLAISAVFYASLGDLLPGLDTGSDEVRAVIQPLNPPPEGTDPVTARAVDQASTDAFRVAMLLVSVLLVAGAVANGLGLRTDATTARASEDQPADQPAAIG